MQWSLCLTQHATRRRYSAFERFTANRVHYVTFPLLKRWKFAVNCHSARGPHRRCRSVMALLYRDFLWEHYLKCPVSPMWTDEQFHVRVLQS